jgi:hypothetical protein
VTQAVTNGRRFPASPAGNIRFTGHHRGGRSAPRTSPPTPEHRAHPVRYFPNKVALVLDEAIALLPEMFQTIAERPGTDQITPAVWARASIGALRTALAVTARHPPADDAPGTPVIDTIRACFAALNGATGPRPPCEVAR